MSVSLPTPSPVSIGLAGPVLRSLSSARQIFALYPSGHPHRREALRELLTAVRALQAAMGTDPALIVARHSIYLGPTLLSRESLSLFRLVDALERAGVVSLEFTTATTEDDLGQLVQLVEGERPLAERLGGIRCNRLLPPEDDGDASDVDLTDLRRAYAMGLEVLRETAVRVSSGKPVDLASATAVVEQLTDEVANAPANALLLTTVKSYDEYTYYHMLNVGLLSIALGQAIGLRRDQVVSLGLGGLLHDVGKVHMPEDVLFHVGKLSEEQWRIVQKHPVDGASLVFGTQEGLFHPAATVVLEHHAAYDLSGYPRLSHRPHPSVPARLVSVADCFDAITSKRAYRAASARRDALGILESGMGRGFDPRVVRVFVGLLGLFPVGSLVRLTSDEIGLVVRNHDRLLARPTVLIVLDAAGNVAEPEERDLTTELPDGRFRWHVASTVDADALGLDVMTFLTTGEIAPAPEQPPTGLVHEPSYGELLPDGYVDTHNTGHVHHHDLPDGGRLDPDVHPGIDDSSLGGGGGG
ncbi:MAG: HD domain-containing protein [Actinobacteria bacterium]|nr:HD domain-containing protein [Actinomycetota bacterium]